MRVHTIKTVFQLNNIHEMIWGRERGKRKRSLICHFVLFFNFNWRIIALLYCVAFCHTSARISRRRAYVSSLLNLPPTPLVCHGALDLSSLSHTANSHWLSVLHIVMYMFQCYFLNWSHLLLPHCVHFVCNFESCQPHLLLWPLLGLPVA